MGDWEQFIEQTPWFAHSTDDIVVGEAGPWPRGGVESLPWLSALLDDAALTPVTVSGARYELLAWGPSHRRRGWLCEEPPSTPVSDTAVHPDHRRFWTLCGGILERFAEPDSWWLNHDDVLTARAARLPVAETLRHYEWNGEGTGPGIPIDPDRYYPAGIEANGNLTLAERDTGRILLFAPDHSFTGVTPLAGCPPYTLYTLDGVPDLAAWIEANARAWREG